MRRRAIAGPWRALGRLVRAAGLCTLLLAPSAAAEEPAEPAPFNLPAATLGGKQFWADLYLYAGWRIQENVFTGHARLLDPADVRRCWGSYAQCRAVFEEIRRTRAIAPRSRHLVLLIHGLGRSKDSFGALEAALRVAGYEAAALNYPSTRRGLAAHAAQIEGLLDGLEDVDRISFVTHSLGGLVLRALLAREGAWRDRIPAQRAILIAPPNQGALVADRLRDFPLYGWIFGAGGQGATTEAATRLPPPPIPFAVIAGGRGDGEGYSPWLEGDDDGLVRVAETRLEEAADFLLVEALHTVVMNDPRSIKAVLSFLETGRF